MRFEAMHAMMFFLPDTHREVLRLLLAWLQRISDDAHRHHVLTPALYCPFVSTAAISSSQQNRAEYKLCLFSWCSTCTSTDRIVYNMLH